MRVVLRIQREGKDERRRERRCHDRRPPMCLGQLRRRQCNTRRQTRSLLVVRIIDQRVIAAVDDVVVIEVTVKPAGEFRFGPSARQRLAEARPAFRIFPAAISRMSRSCKMGTVAGQTASKN